MKRVMLVVGTRPEVIKMAPVIHALRERPGSFEHHVVLTGQHRDMADELLQFFAIEPDRRLDTFEPGQPLSLLAASLLRELDAEIERVRPDWVLAQGDTTSVFAAAVAAFHRKTPFGHVEAGLRTGYLNRPFPEEYNRRVADLGASA